MKEQTGDLKDLKEKRFREINAELENLAFFSIEELKKLYNELSDSKDEYLKYMTKLGVRNDILCRSARFLFTTVVGIVGIIAVSKGTLTLMLFNLLVCLVCLYSYDGIKNPIKLGVLNKYYFDLLSIDDQIFRKEKQAEIELKSTIPDKEVEKQSIDVAYRKDDINTPVQEQPLTLKRDLTKKDEI